MDIQGHKRPVLILSALFTTLLLLGTALPLAALVEPKQTPVRAKEMRHPDLTITDGYLQASAEGAQSRAGALAQIGVSPELAYLDVRTGRWGTLMPSTPLVPGTANSLQALASADQTAWTDLAWDAFVSYLASNEAALGIDVSELKAPGRVAVHDGGDLIQIHAARQVGGVPVRDSFLTAVINHGNLILLGARNWGDLNLSATPSLTKEDAQSQLQAYLGAGLSSSFDQPSLTPRRKSLLEWVPMAAGSGLTYRLVWSLHPGFHPELDRGTWEGLVDAHSGEVLAFQDLNQYATTRTVEGGVLPIANDGVFPDGQEQADWPMPFADLANGGTTRFTDAGGNLLACVDGDVTTTLSGPYMTMNDDCGAISETTAGTVLDLGVSAGTNCTVPAGASPGNTHASRSGFYEMNRIKEMARGQLPDNTWLQEQLLSNMNINDTCNAFWGGGSVNFYRSGGGCANTGELAGVFDHEWGHGMDNNDLNPTISSPGEGIADIYASLRLNTSCMGRSFLGGNCNGYGDPCTSCSGVRDIDWAKRLSGLPHDLTWINANCAGGVHCSGAVYAESVWDIWNRDLPSGFGMSLDTAREIATRLTYLGAGPVGSWFSGAPPFGGCNADGGYLNYLAADDDNGSLADGTPHMSAIFAAFDRHEIACGTPTVADSGCAGAPTSAPSVVATAKDRGAELSWGAVAGADSYRVYRTEGVFGCDFGKILVGDTTETSFLDSGLKNGFEASYIVVPVGAADTCMGPASSCTSVTPTAGANLAIDGAASGAVSFLSGDSDDFLDNCEDATVTVAAVNIGTGSQTNVRIVGVTPVNHPEIQITSVLPLAVSASLAACDVASAELGIYADGLNLGEVVELEVEVTSDEISPATKTQTVRLSLPGTESDLQHFATKTFGFESSLEDWQLQEGVFGRTNTGGGNSTTWFVDSSDEQDNACDRIRSPVIVLSPTSTLSLWNNYDIEPLSGGTWYDRANVGIIDPQGDRTLITPDSGRLYNADSSGPGSYGGCNEPEEGWADTLDSWGTSSWSAAALQSGTFAGDFVQLEVVYGTDGALAQRGFWFDQVSVTNIDLAVADAQSNTCAGPGAVFSDGFESGDTSMWSATVN